MSEDERVSNYYARKETVDYFVAIVKAAAHQAASAYIIFRDKDNWVPQNPSYQTHLNLLDIAKSGSIFSERQVLIREINNALAELEFYGGKSRITIQRIAQLRDNLEFLNNKETL